MTHTRTEQVEVLEKVRVPLGHEADYLEGASIAGHDSYSIG